MLWPGSRPVEFETVAEIDADGSFGRAVSTPEHAGTHLDAPAHFAADGATTDAIEASRLVCEAAVIDAREACAADPDHGVGAEAIEAHEAEHGRLPAGGALLLCTGWGARAGDAPGSLGGTDASDLSFPGFAPSAAELAIERGLSGIGIDTVGVDPGGAREYPVHHRTLPAGLWHLEGLVNLERLPPRGATVVVGVLPLAGGSGAPARVLALL